MDFLKSQLKKDYAEEHNLKINHVTVTFDFKDHIAVFSDDLSSHFKREKVLKSQFEFIQPQRIFLGRHKNENCFYFYIIQQK